MIQWKIGKVDQIGVLILFLMCNNVQIWRHPEFEDEDIMLVSAEVGEGGDHMNITFKVNIK